MASYVMLVRWTDQGVKNVKDSPKRAEAFEAAVRMNGGTLKDLYLVMGEYDFVGILEAPSDEVATKLALSTEMLGSVRTTTLRAFNREEFRKLIVSLS